MRCSQAIAISVFLVLSLANFLAAPGAAPQENPPAKPQENLREEIERLKKKVEELEKKVADLAEEKAAAKKKSEGDEESDEDEESPIPGGGRFKRRGPDREALGKIVLPANASRDQVVEYVRAIAKATSGQNTFSPDDPQVDLLIRAGSRNVGVLIESWESRLEYYLVPAVSQLATDAHKKIILDALRTRRGLIDVVVRRGWVKEAKKTLVEVVRGSKDYLQDDWLDAVASFKDQAVNKDLVSYFVAGQNKRGAYKVLRSISGIDLDKAVRDAWEARSRGTSGFQQVVYSSSDMIPIAIGHGIREALDQGFERLWKKDKSSYEAREIMQAIVAHTDAGGTEEELLAWYEKNKKALRWDPAKKKFLGR